MRDDYHFLEDVLQTKGSAKRLDFEMSGMIESSSSKHNKNHGTPRISINTEVASTITGDQNQELKDHAPHTKKLVKAARARGTNLILMPRGMSKRTINSTMYAVKKDTIFWRLQIVFILSPDFQLAALLRGESPNAGGGDFSTSEQGLVCVSIAKEPESSSIDKILDDMFSTDAVSIGP